MASQANTLKRRLASLADGASRESIQTISRWLIFNRKKYGMTLAKALADVIGRKKNSENNRREDKEDEKEEEDIVTIDHRPMLYMRVTHETIIAHSTAASLNLVGTSNNNNNTAASAVPAGGAVSPPLTPADAKKWEGLSSLRQILAEEVAIPSANAIGLLGNKAFVEEFRTMCVTWEEINAFGENTTSLMEQIRHALEFPIHSTSTSHTAAVGGGSEVNDASSSAAAAAAAVDEAALPPTEALATTTDPTPITTAAAAAAETTTITTITTPTMDEPTSSVLGPLDVDTAVLEEQNSLLDPQNASMEDLHSSPDPLTSSDVLAEPQPSLQEFVDATFFANEDDDDPADAAAVGTMNIPDLVTSTTEEKLSSSVQPLPSSDVNDVVMNELIGHNMTNDAEIPLIDADTTAIKMDDNISSNEMLTTEQVQSMDLPSPVDETSSLSVTAPTTTTTTQVKPEEAKEEKEVNTQEEEKKKKKVEEKASSSSAVVAAATVPKEDEKIDFEKEGVPEAKVEAREFLVPCNTIANMQIARELRSDFPIHISTLLSTIPPEVEEACQKAQQTQNNNNNSSTSTTTNMNVQSLPRLSDELLDLDLNETIHNLTMYRDIIVGQREARKTLIRLLLQSRCHFGSIDSAREFYDMALLVKRLQKRKLVLSDAMELEGLDFEDVDDDENDENGNQGGGGGEEEILAPLSWYNNDDNNDKDNSQECPPVKKMKTEEPS